jgi:uncharacterized membrane protein YcfT
MRQSMSLRGQTDRTLWIDAAKGLCIILVVLFHSTLGVEKDLGHLTWMHTVIEWAKPFRMPDFFLISGLFLSARIARPWREFLDAKVWHFAYFYVLWFHIHFGLRLKGTINEAGIDGALRQYLEAYIDPFGSLWFIYLLAVFCIVAKLVHRQPTWLVMGLGLTAHVAMPHTGIFLIDEFFSRFVFFYTGFAFAPVILAYARSVARMPAALLAGSLALWAIVNTLGMTTGLANVPVFELGFAALGIAAVIATCVALTRQTALQRLVPGRQNLAKRLGLILGNALAYFGRNSIVIYLAFTIFMALTRTVALKSTAHLGLAVDGGMIALVSAIAGFSGALVLHRMVRTTVFKFLFERPTMFRWSSTRQRIAPVRAFRG